VRVVVVVHRHNRYSSAVSSFSVNAVYKRQNITSRHILIPVQSKWAVRCLVC